MSNSNLYDQIVGLMVSTARAHHEATGGVNPLWARWYAEHVLDDLNQALDSDMDVDELEGWFIEADRRYRGHPQAESWPKTYATWIIAERKSTE